MEHTKGKWRVAELQEYNGLFMVKILCPNNNIVVQLTIPTWVGKEEILANAQLIAAAPNLLATCEVAVLALTHRPINPKDIEFIKQAIAEAKG